ncbi:MAG TPA: hypothetical protein VGI55_10060 [Solirubrobacteraceae bacterium]
MKISGRSLPSLALVASVTADQQSELALGDAHAATREVMVGGMQAGKHRSADTEG